MWSSLIWTRALRGQLVQTVVVPQAEFADVDVGMPTEVVTVEMPQVEFVEVGVHTPRAHAEGPGREDR